LNGVHFFDGNSNEDCRVVQTLMSANLRESKNDLKILIVGRGSAGNRHIQNLLRSGCERLSVYRTRRETSETSASDPAIQCYYDLEEALSHDPDVVFITNPTAFHVPVALVAAQRGCNLFIEKPISHTLEGCEKLLDLVKQRELTATVGYNLRFHPVLQTVREIILSGQIGKILSVRAWIGQYLPDWHPGEDYRTGYMARPELGGGVILTLSHELDYLYWLFGEVSEVTAVSARSEGLEMSTESLAEITLGFKSGMLGQVHLDCLRRTPARGCDIIGVDGTIRIDLLKSKIYVHLPGMSEPTTIERPLRDSNATYLDEVTDFLGCVETKRVPKISLEEGVAVLKIALAAHRAAQTGVKQSCR
jgi:predicted dehydrogenase